MATLVDIVIHILTTTMASLRTSRVPITPLARISASRGCPTVRSRVRGSDGIRRHARHRQRNRHGNSRRVRCAPAPHTCVTICTSLVPLTVAIDVVANATGRYTHFHPGRGRRLDRPCTRGFGARAIQNGVKLANGPSDKTEDDYVAIDNHLFGLATAHEKALTSPK